MNLGIEASNIVDGGGMNHLTELLTELDISSTSIKKIFIFSSQKTLDSIPDSKFTFKISHPWLNSGKLKRYLWQIFKSKNEIRSKSIDLFFIPGGVYLGYYSIPVISMSQNMLLYEWKEMARYGLSSGFFRLFFLFLLQSYTFLRSTSILFLTNYAKNRVCKTLRLSKNKSVVIPHGIHSRFSKIERKHESINLTKKRIDILYVSFIGMYKHQWNVIEAIALLRKQGYDLYLTLIGKIIDSSAGKKFQEALREFDPKNIFVIQKTDVSYSDIHSEYQNADIFIYASTCENMPMILMEAMRTGLSIVSSSYGPMPEVLGDAGEYFDPTHPDELVNALSKVLENQTRKKEMAEIAYRKSLKFDWKTTQKLTFDYFEKIYNDYR